MKNVLFLSSVSAQTLSVRTVEQSLREFSFSDFP